MLPFPVLGSQCPLRRDLACSQAQENTIWFIRRIYRSYRLARAVTGNRVNPRRVRCWRHLMDPAELPVFDKLGSLLLVSAFLRCHSACSAAFSPAIGRNRRVLTVEFERLSLPCRPGCTMVSCCPSGLRLQPVPRPPRGKAPPVWMRKEEERPSFPSLS
jgi:hypothetical protein